MANKTDTKAKENKKPDPKNETAVVVKSEALNMSERFTKKVLAEFGSNVAGSIQVTDYQRKLIQGYFISIDRALKTAEDNRQRKNSGNKEHKYDNNIAVVWKNVNLDELAVDLVHNARMGLDMTQDNHLSPVPYKNNKTGQYDITLTRGYNGIQYVAEKYAVEKPTAVTVELVYSSDIFKPFKKSRECEIEGYIFEINDPFSRGEIVGGFGYIEYSNPTKNKLVIMTLDDIEKRKPKYASAEFWGGKKTEYVAGKATEVEIDGWFAEMCLKTIKREVFGTKHIPIDPQKIDDAYQYTKMRETHYVEIETQAEIDAQANYTIIDTTPEEAPTKETELTEEEKQEVIMSEDSAPTEETSPADGPSF